MEIAFISGHLDLTNIEFEKYYIDKINNAIINNHKFVIGNSRGADEMSLNYLLEKKINPENITIFIFSYDKSRNHEEKYKKLGLKTYKSINYKKPEDRDKDMTKLSTYDILYVRDPETTRKMIELQGKKYDPNFVSGTMKNLLRRKN